MIETYGIVVGTERGFAYVETQRQSGCGHCDSQNGCATGTLGRFFGLEQTRFKALNPVEARVGDRVLIGIQDGVLFKGSLAVYIVPLLLMLLGAACAAALAPSSHADGYSVVGAGIGLVAGSIWLWTLNSAMASGRYFQPVILDKLRPQGGIFLGKELLP